MNSKPISKRALVTGASGGIGAVVAEHLAAAGWSLILHAGRHPDRLAPLQTRCATHGVDVATWQADLCSKDLEQQFLDHFGTDHGTTGLAHCAGTTGQGLAARLNEDDAAATMQVHCLAAMQLFKALSRAMLGARFGRIVLIGSTVGLSGNPGQSAYGAAKMAQIGYVRSLAREVGRKGITANVVAPGWIETDMTVDILKRKQETIVSEIPAGRVGTPADVAATVEFLMSEAAGYITGQTLCVNGGLWML